MPSPPKQTRKYKWTATQWPAKSKLNAAKAIVYAQPEIFLGRQIFTYALKLTRAFLQDLYCITDLQRQPVPRLSPPVVQGCKKETMMWK
jgi:hypothetical protein